MTIMKMLYDLTGDELYQPVLQLTEYGQDEIW
jgi:hypothetical protein